MSEINLYHGDCMEAMAQMPDKCYDLAIVDPPYGLGEDGQKNHSRDKLATAKKYTPKSWDNKIPDILYFNEIQRVSNNQIIWGGNYFLDYLGKTPCFIVWDKLNGDNDFADCELAWTSFKSAVRKINHRWAGMMQHDMSNKQIRIHPTEKPIRIYKWLLANYAKPGDKILDTHGGSMSIAIACHDMGFALDLWEIDKDYYDAGVKRFNLHKSQLKIEFA